MRIPEKIGRMHQTPSVVPLRGGLDLISPAMLVQPGFAIAAQNYEVQAQGYVRVGGYERFSGRPKPSDADYYMLRYDVGVAAILAGDVVTGSPSGAMGTALVSAAVQSGTIAGGDAAGFLVLYNVTGTFADNDALRVGGTTRALADGAAFRNGSANDADHITYIEGATAARRDAIGKPPGSGPIRGIATYGPDVYCWRDNAGGTAGQMFKATPTGWAAQTFGRTLLFTGGAANPPAEGATITGATSGHTATLQRIVLNGGAWNGTGTGYLVLGNASGGFTSGENLQVGGVTKFVANGTAAVITLPPGGTYRSVVTNFYAQDQTTRLYVANGVGRAFEWDGTVMAPIRTGTPTASDRPSYIAVHQLHLFLGYASGSVQFSAPGKPLVFDAVQGAGELGFGQAITGLRATKTALIITGRNRLGYLTGTDKGSFSTGGISEDSGAIADTLEVVGTPLFMDDQGVRDLQAAETFGDWNVGTKTRMVEPLLRAKRDAGVLPVAAMRVRNKDQYRLFYSDGTGLILYFGRGDPEIMTFTLGFAPSCTHSGENAAGNEILFVGSVDGWVYQVDVGTSFDGGNIEAFLRTSWLNQNMPNIEKRYHRGRIEGQAGARNTVLAISADFAYGSDQQPPAAETAFTFHGSGGFWDEDLWDLFSWSAQSEGQAFFDLDGLGENVSPVIMSDSATEYPHTLSTLTINFSTRRQLR